MKDFDNIEDFRKYLDSLPTNPFFDCANSRYLQTDVTYTFKHGEKEFYGRGCLLCMKALGAAKFTDHRCGIRATSLFSFIDGPIESLCRYGNIVFGIEIKSSEPLEKE